MGVQVVPSGEVWIWNAVAYAASQFSVTWQIVWLDPRATSSHCGSENALDQRVPVLPSTTALAGEPAFSVEEAVAVLFSATFVVPQPPPPPPPPPLPVGSVHCWSAAPVQVSMSSLDPVLPPGSVRQSPELGLTSSPLD